MDEKLTPFERACLWITAAICGLLIAGVLVGEVHASRDITTRNIPKTLYVYSEQGNEYVGKVESTNGNRAWAYHEYLHILFEVDRYAITTVSGAVFFETQNCTGVPYISVEASEFWEQTFFGLEKVSPTQYEVLLPYGTAGGYTSRSVLDANGICRSSHGDEVWARPGEYTGKYLPTGPYKIKSRSTKPPRGAVER